VAEAEGNDALGCAHPHRPLEGGGPFEFGGQAS